MTSNRLSFAVLLSAALVAGQQDSAAHHDAVNSRGDHAMGFSHENATHHFRLSRDGGVIDVTVNNPNDRDSRDAIREHLSHIARSFAAGDFDVPMFIHDQVPPGVPQMKRWKNDIRYDFARTDRGARITISTRNPEAVQAVHDFLRFQIADHLTGDPLQP